MPPPPLPFFSGLTVTASETTDGLLAIRPLRGHGFVAPAGTRVLYLPTVSLIRAQVRRLADPAWSVIEFAGEFSRVERPSPTVLEAVGSEDADALVRGLNARFGLPRTPRRCGTEELREAQEVEFVEVVGIYAPGHFEAANFEGLQLTGELVARAGLVSGRRYRVTAIFRPGLARGGGMPRPVGYSGPLLHVQSVTPEERAGGVVMAGLEVAACSSLGSLREHHQEAAVVFVVGGASRRAGETPIVGEWSRETGVALVVLDGMGGQSTGDIACEMALSGFAAGLQEALPTGGEARALWLKDRVARVSQHLKVSSQGERGAAVAVALVVADELHLVHLGHVRISMFRAGQLRALTVDHLLRNDALAAGVDAEQLAAIPDDILTRGLGWSEPELVEVTSVALREDDVLLLTSCGVHSTLREGEVARILGEAGAVGASCAALVAAADRAARPERNDNISVIVARVRGG